MKHKTVEIIFRGKPGACRGILRTFVKNKLEKSLGDKVKIRYMKNTKSDYSLILTWL